MKAERRVLVNAKGLEIEVEQVFIEKDEAGNEVNEYCMSLYDSAKCAVYADLDKKLPIQEEQMRIANMMSVLHNKIGHHRKGGEA